MNKLIKRLFVILTVLAMMFGSIPVAFADENESGLIDKNQLVFEEIEDDTEVDIDVGIDTNTEVIHPKDEDSDILDEESEHEITDAANVDQEDEDTETGEEPDTNVPGDTGSKAEEEEVTKAADSDHEHSEGVWNVEPASFDKDGRKQKVCPDCREILEEEPIYKVSNVTFDNEAAAYVYDGKEVIPTVTVRDLQGNLLTEDVDYTIEFANNDKIGKAKATITLQGENYSGKKDFTFSILNGELKRMNLLAGDSKTVTIDSTITRLLGEDITYSIEDEFVATVNANGEVTGVNAGKTVLTVAVGGCKFQSEVIVIKKQSRTLVESKTDDNYKFTFIYDGTSSYEIELNGAWVDTYQGYKPCEAVVELDDKTYHRSDVVYESVESGYGTIYLDPNNLYLGREYEINVSWRYWDFSDYDFEYDDGIVSVSVYKRPIPEVIAFDKTSYDLLLTEKKKLGYISDCDVDSFIRWTSSDTAIATVSNGTVTAKKPGTCTITATLPGGNADQCTVNVYQNSDLKFTNTSEKLYGLSSKTLSLVNQSAIYDKITWKSSNTKIATVDSNGKVTAKEAGTVTITATVATIKKSATCKVTVIPKIKTKTVKVYLKKSYTNKLFAASGKVKWSSSNKKIATVSSKGKITGKKPGKCTITAKYKGKKYTCKVTVKHIKLSKKSAELARGKTLKLKVTGGSDKIKWKTSNRKVATVSSKGVVKAIDPGTCTISMTRNGYTKKCKVKVYRRKPDFDAEIMEYNTRNNYFVVWFENAGSKTLTITSGIKVEDDDYKKFDRSIRLNKKVKIKPGKSKYVRFYVKGSTTWWDYGDFTLYYKFTYDGKTYMAYARDDMDYSSYKRGTKWYDTYQEYRGEIDGE